MSTLTNASVSSPWSLTSFSNDAITTTHLHEAAAFFGTHYGLWGPLGRSPGHRIRMSSSFLRKAVIPSSARERRYIRAYSPSGTYIGHIFACAWTFPQDGVEKNICWATQLVVHAQWRNRGVAKSLLAELRDERYDYYALASSHPFSCRAAWRVFSPDVSQNPNIDDQDVRVIKEALAQSPVEYVRDSKPVGKLVDVKREDDGLVCALDSGFFVDQRKPGAALDFIRARDMGWPYGEAQDGCEFLVFVQAARRAN